MTEKFNLYKSIATSLITVALASSFLTIFFFTYAKNIEKQVVINNINYLISDINDNYLNLLPNQFKYILKSKLSQVELGDMSDQDEITNKSNKKLVMKAAISFFILFITLFSIALFICYYTKQNLYEILIVNFILMLGIGTVEYIFATFIISKYLSLDVNTIKYNILNSILKSSDNNKH